jgi:hypothetical protein
VNRWGRWRSSLGYRGQKCDAFAVFLNIFGAGRWVEKNRCDNFSEIGTSMADADINPATKCFLEAINIGASLAELKFGHDIPLPIYGRLAVETWHWLWVSMCLECGDGSGQLLSGASCD